MTAFHDWESRCRLGSAQAEDQVVSFHVYQGQHRLLTMLSALLLEQSVRLAGPDEALDCHRLIGLVGEVLDRHLDAEDAHLYPSLMTASDPAIADLAAFCFEEMGGIRGGWDAYREAWDVERIAAQPERFERATAAILSALRCRIDREEETLYPAAQRAGLAKRESVA